jgi:CubicO group peptidase (beta-lactamase class C family)
VAAQNPVTPHTLVGIGSFSKSFTALALLQLRDAGRLDLHAPVAHYLPWFHVPSRYGLVTLHHLLSHTAGIIRGSDCSTEARYGLWLLRAARQGQELPEMPVAPGPNFVENAATPISGSCCARVPSSSSNPRAVRRC